MKHSKIDTVLITALGKCKRAFQNIRLEFYDKDSLYISSTVAPYLESKTSIVTNAEGHVEFIDEGIVRCVASSGKIDEMNSAPIALNIPSIYSKFASGLEKKFSTITNNEDFSVNSRKKTSIAEVWLFELINRGSRINLKDLLKEAFPGLRRPSSLKHKDRPELVQTELDSDLKTGSKTNSQSIQNYLRDVMNLFYSRIRITSLDYICGKS